MKVNKKLVLKFKLSISVFESLNKTAYDTQKRALGCGSAAKQLLAHPTFCDTLLPLILGNNKLNSDWEQEKYEYIHSIQISIPTSGLDLNLNYTFNPSDKRFSSNIAQFIVDNGLSEVTTDADGNETIVNPSDEKLHEAIVRYAPVIDHHMYFTFENVKDYIYWCVATLSNQVANNPEDVEKSTNIRFFIYDPLIANKKELAKTTTIQDCINKLLQIKSNHILIQAIALQARIISYADIDSYSDDDIYLQVFNSIIKGETEAFMEAATSPTLQQEVFIEKLINAGILVYDNDNAIVDGSNSSIVIGTSLYNAVKYFADPINKGEATKYTTKLNSLK